MIAYLLGLRALPAILLISPLDVLEIDHAILKLVLRPECAEVEPECLLELQRHLWSSSVIIAEGLLLAAAKSQTVIVSEHIGRLVGAAGVVLRTRLIRLAACSCR